MSLLVYLKQLPVEFPDIDGAAGLPGASSFLPLDHGPGLTYKQLLVHFF